jgi:hypothetical protein
MWGTVDGVCLFGEHHWRMVLSVGQKQYTRAIKEVKKKEEKGKKMEIQR